MPKGTRTYTYGASNREGHDASEFYGRNMYGGDLPRLLLQPGIAAGETRPVPERPLEEWADQVYCQSSEHMADIPDGSVGLAFTSPPYNAGKDFDQNLDMAGYFRLIAGVAAEVHRVLRPGGRYVVNIANLGRKPYIPMHAYFYSIHMAAGFLPSGEVVWRKGKGQNGSCAWGSWRSAKAPRLRDVHEYLLVFAKERFDRPDRGETGISPAEFMAGTLSVWDIAPESARRVGHPAPFPVQLAARTVNLFSYAGDVVLDPFCGSGTTCVAAAIAGRRYVGYDTSPEYCQLAKRRIAEAARQAKTAGPEAPGAAG